MLNGKSSAPICPLTLRPGEPSKLVGTPSAGPMAIPCVGKQCAWFVPVHDAAGKEVGGGCAAAMLAMQAFNLTNNTHALVQLGQINLGKKYPDLVVEEGQQPTKA